MREKWWCFPMSAKFAYTRGKTHVFRNAHNIIQNTCTKMATFSVSFVVIIWPFFYLQKNWSYVLSSVKYIVMSEGGSEIDQSQDTNFSFLFSVCWNVCNQVVPLFFHMNTWSVIGVNLMPPPPFMRAFSRMKSSK